jgi:hypothetical protein
MTCFTEISFNYVLVFFIYFSRSHCFPLAKMAQTNQNSVQVTTASVHKFMYV